MDTINISLLNLQKLPKKMCVTTLLLSRKHMLDIDAFKSASKPVYEDYKKNAGSLGAQLLDAASKL